MGPLTPKLRSIIRKDFSRIVPNSNIKISLLSTALSQNIRHSTYLQEIKSLLKGSAFQRLITFNIPTTIKEQEAATSYVSEQIKFFFDNLKKIGTSEVNFSMFNPVAVFFPTKEGSLLPRRYSNINGYLSKTKPAKLCALENISLVNTPIISICNTLEVASKKLLFILSRV